MYNPKGNVDNFDRLVQWWQRNKRDWGKIRPPENTDVERVSTLYTSRQPAKGDDLKHGKYVYHIGGGKWAPLQWLISDPVNSRMLKPMIDAAGAKDYEALQVLFADDKEQMSEFLRAWQEVTR